MRHEPSNAGLDTITILRSQNVVVRFTARATGSPSVPALAG
jgi:hypothetical protein